MLNTVIFDMDGLLIDSEPLWETAGMETLAEYGISLSRDEYYRSTGLRTREWVEFWFAYFGVDAIHTDAAITNIVQKAIQYIGSEGVAFPGTSYIIDFFKERNFKIGLATSSPLDLVNVVISKLGLKNRFDMFTSAEFLSYGKPHPQVYIECAAALGSTSISCLCFEDSFNGMIAAKAAKMKCVAIPHTSHRHEARWGAADLTLDSLMDFNDEALGRLQ
ncbi:MAG: hexitol phosphatase HxpB [Chitinophagaceae bacterium]